MVYGNPVRPLDPFSLIKTILFFNLIIVNSLLCEELQSKIVTSTEQFKSESEYETPEESEVRIMRQKWEAEDVKLNKEEIQEGRYWVNGEWIERKNENYRRVNGGWVYDDPKAKNITEKSESELVNKEVTIIRKAKNIATFSMEGCEQGFHFPAISKDIIPIGIAHKALKTLNDFK